MASVAKNPALFPDPVKHYISSLADRNPRALSHNYIRATIPRGWPSSVTSPSCWTGRDLKAKDYLHILTEDERSEIRTALDHFKGLELDGHEIHRNNFPLPTLSTSLEIAKRNLFTGRGIFVLRGIDPTEYRSPDQILIFLGISSYIAEKRGKQDRHGNILVHLRDTGVKSPYPNRSSASSLGFHSDGPTDIMAMQTRGCAAKGGDSMLASSEMVYNELIHTRPDVIRTLAAPDWPADVNDPELKDERRASLFFHNGRIILNFSAALIKAHARLLSNKNQHLLTANQLDALETVFKTASKHYLKINMQPGDLQFVNNFAILHAREEFKDDAFNKRHLVRMWLSCDRKWNIPYDLEKVRSMIFDGDDESEENWEIDPMPGKKPPLPYCLSH